MKKPPTMIPLGYAVGTGEPVSVPLAHTFVTGQTQASGKTTTLQAIVARSGRRALAFVTKRGEQLDGRAIRPYLPREGDREIHWRFVETIMASALGQRALKYERLQIINAAKDAKSLDDVRRNLTRLLGKAKAGSPSAGIYELLGEYLDLVLPEMRALRAVHGLDLRPGLNVMNLVDASADMQALAIGAAIGRVNDGEEGVLSVFPEAWQFAPRDRNTAAKFEAEKTARMGAAIGNFLLCDSQDIVGVSPVIRQAASVWIVGVQGEANELKRTLEVVKGKVGTAPRAADVSTLGLGQFYVCHGGTAIKTYVRPNRMSEDEARDRARRDDTSPAAGPIVLTTPAPNAAGSPVIGAHADDDGYCGCERLVFPHPPAPGCPRWPTPATPVSPEPIDEPAAPPADAPTPAADAPHDESEDDVSEMKALNEKFDRLLSVLTPAAMAQPTSPRPQEATPSPSMAAGEDAMYERFKARLLAELPRIAVGGPVTLTPPDKLRKDFQQAEADRLTTAAKSMRPLLRDVLRLLEGVGGQLSQRAIAERLGRATGGGSWVDLSKALKELDAGGFVQVVERQGARSLLRAKVAADLATYQATDAEVEAVYQNVLHHLASAGE